ncbi:MAG: hypothetical protein PF693_09755, partial [Spirochaetia bacterium]|nr:hypothetical protein [Spirochaetia bacterium]
MIKTKIYLKYIIVIILTFFLLSCLEIETRIEINDDLSGVWTLNYKIMQEASYITPGNELFGYNYFPSNEAEFLNRIEGISGLEILSFSTENTILYT